jgi:hypothetical protein
VLRAAGVQQVVLVHGTFTGNDAWGLVRGLEWLVPAVGDTLRQTGQQWVDWLARDVGNYYSDGYVQAFQQWLRDEPSIGVQRFMWSGENYHLGRADAAIRLLELLLAAAQQGCLHSLLWGHSHAGNVLALATNLLGSSPQIVQRFFAACRPLFWSSHVSPLDRQRWQHVQQLLQQRDLIAGLCLEIVTFGTPVRYGWETSGYRQLLHIVHHRPAPGLPEYRASFPFTWDDVSTARQGDYVQQLGIAGTDFLPATLSWRAVVAERNLRRLLQDGLRRRDTLQRLGLGVRVANEGQTLLVDYPDDATHCRQRLLGHAIYTSPDWLPYHLQQVVTRFYGAPQP